MNCFQEADTVISKVLVANGVDYYSYRREIADLFDTRLYQDSWCASTDFGDEGLPNLYFIQEDEYDQSLSEEEKPDWDTMICYACGYYVFPG
jgi:hypothetical protein